jgi:2-beta-glucuronyltransferase
MSNGASLGAEAKRVVLISGYHDYRTAKRASIHQIAHALARSGYDVSFIATRFSWLSRRRGTDSRLFLWDKANQIEVVDGIRCLLWRTSLHPFHSRNRLGDAFLGTLFPAYAELPSAIFDDLVSQADHIIIEAGVPAIYLRRLRRLNPAATIICYCTDRPDVVGSHPFVRQRMIDDEHLVDYFVVRARAMAEYFNFVSGPLYRVGFGINPEEFANIGPSPYHDGDRAAVSVGSMLFDEQFFAAAAPAFPDLQFQVIGSGTELQGPPNLHVHAEMPYADTLPFVKHAAIGIAPYRAAPGGEYLADSSLKLAQFEYFGLPAVCPHFAVGDSAARVGYEPGDPQSIQAAVTKALALVGKVEPRSFPTWSEVAVRVLNPAAYPDTLVN